MHRLSALRFAGALLLGGLALGQASQRGLQTPATTTPPQSASSQPAAALLIAPGTVFPVTLAKSLDAKKAKAGDPVEAKVSVDLKADNGEVVVPSDSKVLGHVTQAQARTKEQKESQLGLAFDHLVIKNGADVTLPVSIQAIIAPSPPNENNSPVGGNAPGLGGTRPGAGGLPSGGAGMPPQPGVPVGGTTPTRPPTSTPEQPPINSNTQGVVGFSHLTLSPAANPAQGSLISSEKSNVKLEGGTLVLLRVNP
ncbi:MAG TPA: hypothetical protein VEI01_03560 [Terriglobales bacterium]|nr:hypothetical protein [Terriglobales bacterium]